MWREAAYAYGGQSIEGAEGETYAAAVIERAIADAVEQERAKAEALAEALGELKGQVEQARDGFDHWPYNNSDSMKAVLARSDEALASYREKTNG